MEAYHRYFKCLLLLLALAIFACAIWSRPDHPQSRFFAPRPAPEAVNPEPYFESDFVSVALHQYVHAASMTELPSGGLMAVWFAGSREGASDVSIYSARFDPHSREWGEPQVLVDRPSTEQAVHRMIRKLGNPVIGTAPNGRLWLFYVSVSVGGWAGSAINFMTSEDEGKTWSLPRRLTTTPFFNISTLVRGQPVFHDDGTIGLPVYHEFLDKFPEYLRLDQEGNVIDKARMTTERATLQPSTVILDETRAISFLRDSGMRPRRVMVSETDRTGESWSEARMTPIPNPNSGLSAVRYSDTEILVALNDLESDRYRLSLYLADIGLTNWRRVKVLEESPDPEGRFYPDHIYRDLIREQFLKSDDDSHQELLPDYLNRLDQRMCEKAKGCTFIYDYPYLIRDENGHFHLIYTWNKSLIKHLEFNKAWVEQVH